MELFLFTFKNGMCWCYALALLFAATVQCAMHSVTMFMFFKFSFSYIISTYLSTYRVQHPELPLVQRPAFRWVPSVLCVIQYNFFFISNQCELKNATAFVQTSRAVYQRLIKSVLF